MSNRRILISVCMITYNHEFFIEQAIEGVLNQSGDFELEIIVADDFSPDRTFEIVNSYIKNHPKGGSIQYFRHKKNFGMEKNFIWALSKCKGELVALCEGDDYWINKNHLENQISIFKKAPYILMSGAITNIIKKENNEWVTVGINPLVSFERFKNIGISEFLKGKFYPSTVSRVYKNSIIKDFVIEFNDSNLVCEWLLSLYCLHKSFSNLDSIGFGNYVCGIYRQSDIGVWHSKSIAFKVKSDYEVIKFAFKSKWNLPITFFKEQLLAKSLFLFKNKSVPYYDRFYYLLRYFFFRIFFLFSLKDG